jgi:hypothetical protein
MEFNRSFGIRKTFTYHRMNIIGVVSCFSMTKTATCKDFAIVKSGGVNPPVLDKSYFSISNKI